MGRPLKISKLNTNPNVGKDIGFPAVATLTVAVTPAGLDSDEFYGCVGGSINANGDAQSGKDQNRVVLARVYITGESEEDGYILRQKGSSKYLVYGASSNATGVCTLADEADGALTEGNMTLTVELSDSTPFRLKRLTNKWGIDYSDNYYFINMFQGVAGETAIKSGTAQVDTTIARIETISSPT
jgi:hypothetical protein